VDADRRLGRYIADLMQMLAAEPGDRARAGDPVPDPAAARRGQGFPELTGNDSECPGGIAMVMESRVLARQPAQQPDLVVLRQREALEPALAGPEPDQRAPGLVRCGRADDAAELSWPAFLPSPSPSALLAPAARPGPAAATASRLTSAVCIL
jgi:hypothetical protein